MQDKQILGGADWMSSEKFDINAKPGLPGAPRVLGVSDRLSPKGAGGTGTSPAFDNDGDFVAIENAGMQFWIRPTVGIE